MKKILLGLCLLFVGAGLSAQDFKVNSSGYLENNGAHVMVFNDVYPEGHQGGVTLVLNDERRAASGDVRFEASQGQWQGFPRVRKREVDEAANEIRVTLSYPDTSKHMAGFNPAIYPDFAFDYTVKVKGEKDYVVLTVDLDRPVPERFAGKLGFNLELVPSILLGKPWILDDQTGIFPHQVMGPTTERPTNMDHIGDFNPRGKADLDQLLLDRKTYNPMIADDIIAMPDGFNTYVGERGTLLSGGQKQRVAIARIFLKNPPILILDEATSSLDNESEYIVQCSLEQLAKNRTTLTIAHRLTTIKNASRILFLTPEGITEEGTHDELVAKKGYYYSLVQLQTGEEV